MKKFIVFLLLITLYSCDKNQLQENDSNNQQLRIYPYSKKIIWENINRYLSDKNIEPLESDKEKGIIHFETKIAGSLVSKYSTFNLPNKFSKLKDVVCNVYLIIKPIGNETELEIISSFNGVLEIEMVSFKGKYLKTNNQKLSSSGTLEKELLDFIENPIN